MSLSGDTEMAIRENKVVGRGRGRKTGNEEETCAGQELDTSFNSIGLRYLRGPSYDLPSIFR